MKAPELSLSGAWKLRSSARRWGALSGGVFWIGLAFGALFACQVQAPHEPAREDEGGQGGAPTGLPQVVGGNPGLGGEAGEIQRPLSPSCPAGTFDADPKDELSCLAWSSCRPGEYVAEEGSALSDRVCMACPRSTFSEVMNAAECEDYLVCKPGQYVLEPGTKSETQTCEECEAGTFSASTNSAQCEPCPTGSFAAEDGQDSCDPWRRCGFSEGIAISGTAESDVVCKVQSGSRQFGTEGDDAATAIALDLDGNIYLAGNSAGALEGAGFGKGDGFIRKFDAAGQVLWTRQFGSSEADIVTGLVVGSEGEVVIVGFTLGALPGQESQGSSDAFLLRYDREGREVWARQFGTDKIDSAKAVTLSAAGDIFVAGQTYGELNGAENAGGADAFVVKFAADGSPLWTHTLGLAGTDQATGLGRGLDNELYVIGTVDGKLPNCDAFGGVDAFLRKLDRDGYEVWTEQFGSSGSDEATAMVADESGDAFVVGGVQGTLPGRQTAGESDYFVRKYRGDGSILGTVQAGSSEVDVATSVLFGRAGELIVAGTTLGALAGQEPFGAADGFVSVWTSDLKTETLTTQFGSDQNDTVSSIALGPEDSLFSAGSTRGQLPGQPREGGADAFLMLLPLGK